MTLINRNNYELKNIISLKEKEIFEFQNNKCICKITNKNFESFTGFFCKIPYKSDFLSVLISSSRILYTNNKEIIRNINIIINNEKEYKTLKIDENREVFVDKLLNIAIIEIKKDDNINFFLDLDDNINKGSKYIKTIYENISKYTLFYSKYNNNIEYHNISNNVKEIGSPIILSSNNKVIGIIDENSNLNYTLSNSIKNFIVQFNKEKEVLNELTILYDIKKVNDEIKIFDEIFVSNNKNNCKLLIEGKEKIYVNI